jgi:hypothetical protein
MFFLFFKKLFLKLAYQNDLKTPKKILIWNIKKLKKKLKIFLKYKNKKDNAIT